MSSPGQYQLIVGEPKSGGDLITDLSLDNVGISNYSVKRDWRRELDGEIRREGHVLFAPNGNVSPNIQSNIGDPSTINLIHFARKPNGQTATIVGTQTALYRYFSFDDGEVYANGTYETGVYEDLTGQWLKIASNLSTSGNRWEAVDVAGQTVFNNGVDLPLLYDLGWLRARPIYELREQGVASVGTIAEFDGMLLVGDVSEINDLTTVMEGRGVSSMSQSGNTVSATVSTFVASDVGKTIVWGTGQNAMILNIVSPTVVNVDNFQTVALGPVKISYLFGAITDSSLYSRIQYRVMNSNVGNASDFGSGVSLVDAEVGQFQVVADNPMYSLNVGDEVTIQGAGVAGAALITTVIAINAYHDLFTLADAPSTFVKGPFLQRSDRVGSVASSFDLEDDNSAVLRMIELQGRLVVLKDGPIFIGTATGATDAPPISFQKVYSGPYSIYWKYMLAKVNGQYLLYAGRHGFYTFDLSSLSPHPHQKLQLCQNLFYDQATSASINNSCWATDNPITNEIWFFFPSTTSDHGISYDYLYDTCSTIGYDYKAAGAIRRPGVAPQTGALEQWFMLGDVGGEVYQYGLTNLSGTTGTWTRNGATYPSSLASGLIFASDQFDQKDLRNYVLYFGKYPNTPVLVTVNGTRNAHEPMVQLFQKTIVAPTYKNLIPTYFRKNYYQDQIDVLAATSNAKIVRRSFELSDIDTRSAVRNDST